MLNLLCLVKMQLRSQLLRTLTQYKSVNHMLSGDNMILKKLGYVHNHDLTCAFCLGAVFAEISSKVEIHSFPGELEGETLEEAHELFLKFVRGEFED